MTTTTMMTTLDVLTPTDSTTPFPPSQLITQSAPSTPLPQRIHENGNPESRNTDQGVVSHNNKNNNYYLGLGVMYERIFSCFKPVWSWGSFGKATSNGSSSPDDWEIPFESITNLEWIGAGSQAAVFRGEFNGKTVAVRKVNKLDDITSVRSLRKLDHPNVIKFIGLCTQSPCYCLVMEFCSRGQLCTVLESEPNISWKLWVNWLQQIASGMNYLHKNNVIHRDLKSPNILLNEDNVIKICDFGTSQQPQDLHSTLMSFCGTVSWMAPEVIKKMPCNEKVDVYSFGVVLWEMLTREKPYKDISSLSIMYGVGNNYLSLPIPPTAPEGLKLLLKQCFSQTPRNRPSFQCILQHIEILKAELEKLGDEMWLVRYDEWNKYASEFVYPETLAKEPVDYEAEARDLYRRRQDELKHAQDIRLMFEIKMKRMNKMFSKMNECMNDLKIREQEVGIREQILAEVASSGCRSRGSSFNGNPRPIVVRAGPKTIRGDKQDTYSYPLPHGVNYGQQSDNASSSDEEFYGNHRNSPHRFSHNSSCSNLPSSQSATFSRQSSCRSSSGRPRREYPRESPNYSGQGTNESRAYSEHVMGGAFNRDECLRHSCSSQWGELIRGSPARNSGCSEDSGVHCQYSSCSGLNTGSPACTCHNLYRNVDGRWSDGKISQKRRAKKPSFHRDSPARLPPYRSKKSAHSSKNDLVFETDNRNYRAKSLVPEQMLISPDGPPVELSVSSLSQSSSYEEALKMNCYSNPIYQSPTSSKHKQKSPEHQNSYEHYLKAVDPNIDLTSSLESDNHNLVRSIQTDASSENSDPENEENGNILDSSMDSQRLPFKLLKESTDGDDFLMDKRKAELALTTSNSSAMASSLERSLELAAMHSDGLSDKEKMVKAVKASIKGHRRSHSHPVQTFMVIKDETSTESEGVDV